MFDGIAIALHSQGVRFGLHLSLGWHAPLEHPSKIFIESGAESLVEEIRTEAEYPNNSYKYAHAKYGDRIVQVGVLVNNVQDMLDAFEVQSFIDSIAKKGTIKDVSFIDNDFKVTASSNSELIGTYIEKPEHRTQILSNKAKLQQCEMCAVDMIHVCSPIYVGGEKTGALCFEFHVDMLKNSIKQIAFVTYITFSVVVFTVAAILYYAYRKNLASMRVAYTDTLTKLPNKLYLHRHLEDILKEKDEIAALLFLNIKNFKIINLSYGYRYGDEMLTGVSALLKERLPEGAKLFRYEGDRFAIVVSGRKDKKELEALALELVSAFESTFSQASYHDYIRLHIGIYMPEKGSMSVDKVLHNATLALNSLGLAKDTPDNGTAFYSADMGELVRREALVENELRACMADENRDSFALVFQPKLHLTSGQITGFEALSRLQIPELGFVPPPDFIRVAEERGFIFEFGNLILKKAAAFVALLQARGHRDVKVAVNISALQLLRNDFPDIVLEICQNARIEPHLLEFEITESVFFDNFEIINEKLAQFASLGIMSSLDDFGMGYSSFARLRELSISAVKLDKLFIDRIAKVSENSLVLPDIISMAHRLGLGCIAEGVETREQFDYLKAHNCDMIQGYYFGKPMPRDMAMGFLEEHKS